jgi:hypothetical protein
MVVVLEEARQNCIAHFAWKEQEAVWTEGKGSVCVTAAGMQCSVGLDQTVYLLGYGVLYLVSRTLFHA